MCKPISLIFVIFIGFAIKIQAQQSVEMWTKIATEIRMNIENSPLELRLRPDDHIFLPSKYVPSGSLARIDFMVGLNFWKFKLFDYTKYDEAGSFWNGPRFDFNFELFKKKLLFSIIEEYFWGLNEKSKDHYYLTQYIRYQTSQMSYVGVLCYGKWNVGKDFNTGNWFVGPSIEIAEKSGLSIQLAFTKDVLSDLRYMTYIKLNYKFMVRDKTKPITIDDE